MQASNETDQVDFKPFFDLIVGILFILIILISAQMFFAQRAAEKAVTDPQTRLRIERDKQIENFLEAVAQRLRDDGVAAQSNFTTRSIVLPADPLLAAGDAGAPSFTNRAIESVAAALAQPLACVAESPVREGCADWPLLRAEDVAVRFQGKVAPPASGLPPDRYLGVATSVLYAALLSHKPALATLSSTAGAPLIRPAAPDAGPAAPERPHLTISLVFRE